MSATYSDAGVDPISRVRRLTGDTLGEGVIQFSDEQYWRWLEASLSSEQLWLWMPTTNSGRNTAATAKVMVVPEDGETPQSLALELAANVTGTETITLIAADGSGMPWPTMVGQLARRILKLGVGWHVGLLSGGGFSGDVEWFDESDLSNWGAYPQAVDDPANETFVLQGRSNCLALTGRAEAEVEYDCYGEWWQDSAKPFKFYRFGSAGALALRAYLFGIDVQSGGAASFSEGDMSWSRGPVQERLALLSAMAGGGLYTDAG